MTQAETLAGQKLEFPAALAGKAAVCVFGFSKEAGDGTKVWMTRLSEDGINSWSIANLHVRFTVSFRYPRSLPENYREPTSPVLHPGDLWRKLGLGIGNGEGSED